MLINILSKPINIAKLKFILSIIFQKLFYLYLQNIQI